MTNTRNGFNDLIYIPRKEYLITKNLNDEHRNQIMNFFYDLARKLLTVDDENFEDHVKTSQLTAEKKQLLLERHDKLDVILAKQSMIDFFQKHDINEKQLEQIIHHWNRNVTGNFILESMQENAKVLGKMVTATTHADLTLENNQIMIKTFQKHFTLIDQWNKNTSPQLIHTSYFASVNEKPTVQVNPSAVITHFELTSKGFKLCNIVFSDKVIKSLYIKDSLKLLEENKKECLKEFTDNIALYLEEECLTYHAVKDANNLNDKTNKEIEALLDNPEQLKKLNPSAYEKAKKFEFNCSMRDAIIYSSIYTFVRTEAINKQINLYANHPMYEEGDNCLHLDWINFKNDLFDIYVNAVNKRIVDMKNQFVDACAELLRRTDDDNISMPLRLSGDKVLSVITTFTENKMQSIDAKVLKNLTHCLNETTKVINYAVNLKQSAQDVPFLSNPNYIDNYANVINNVMGLGKNKWEVIGKAMIGVVGAIVLAAAIATLIVVTSGTALPVIIAGIALGIKIGAIAGTATVATTAMVGGTFFAKCANDGKIACAGKEVLKAVKRELSS